MTEETADRSNRPVRIASSRLAYALDRFREEGPSGYCAASLLGVGPIRATRAEAEADEESGSFRRLT